MTRPKRRLRRRIRQLGPGGWVSLCALPDPREPTADGPNGADATDASVDDALLPLYRELRALANRYLTPGQLA